MISIRSVLGDVTAGAWRGGTDDPPTQTAISSYPVINTVRQTLAHFALTFILSCLIGIRPARARGKQSFVRSDKNPLPSTQATLADVRTPRLSAAS